MSKTSWKKARRAAEVTLWIGVLAFAAYRFGPQVGAALGVGGSPGPLEGGAITTLDGTALSVDDLKGKVVLVNIWATWCPPCVIEMPGFQRVYEDYRDRGFLVLGVSRDQGEPSRVRTFLREKGITYPVAMASDVDLGGMTQVEALPTSFLIGRDGTIRHQVEGFFAGLTLRMAVKRLVEEDTSESGG